MIDGKINRKSGFPVIDLPSANSEFPFAGHGENEITDVYPKVNNRHHVGTRAEHRRLFPLQA